jgi:hypothetical protein
VSYTPPPLSTRTDADLAATLTFFERRTGQWADYARKFGDPAGLFRDEAARWSARADAVRAEIAARQDGCEVAAERIGIAA